MEGWVYILICSDGSYYTGSTIHIERRLSQHQCGLGANHTRKRLPVKLIYLEKHKTIFSAFRREKQIQGWSRNKKKALIANMPEQLKRFAECMNESHYKNYLQ